MKIKRLGADMTLHGTPRTDYPANEGALGISFSETAIQYQNVRSANKFR